MLKVRNRNIKWSDIKMTEMDLDKLVLHFAQCMRAEGKSPKTISWYGEMIGSFIGFLKNSGKAPILAQFSLENAREFVINEQRRGVSPYTIQARVRSLKGFSSWLFGESYISENVLSYLKIPRVPVKIIDVLTTEEIDKLVSVQNPLTGIGSRNLAILITFLGTGIRESELTNLRFEDSHIEEGYIKVMGKGSKERVVPIGTLVQKLL